MSCINELSSFLDELLSDQSTVSDEARLLVNRDGELSARTSCFWNLRCVRSLSGQKPVSQDIITHYWKQHYQWDRVVAALINKEALGERKGEPLLSVRDVRQTSSLLDEFQLEKGQEEVFQKIFRGIKEISAEVSEIGEKIMEGLHLVNQFLKNPKQWESFVTEITLSDLECFRELTSKKQQLQEQGLASGKLLRVYVCKQGNKVFDGRGKVKKWVKDIISEEQSQQLGALYPLIRQAWERLDAISEQTSKVDLQVLLAEKLEFGIEEKRECGEESPSMNELRQFLFEASSQGERGSPFHVSPSSSPEGSPLLSPRFQSRRGSQETLEDLIGSTFGLERDQAQEVIQTKLYKGNAESVHARQISICQVARLIIEVTHSRQLKPLRESIHGQLQTKNPPLAKAFLTSLDRYEVVNSYLTDPLEHHAALLDQMKKDGFLLPDENEVTLSQIADYVDWNIQGIYDLAGGMTHHSMNTLNETSARMITAGGNREFSQSIGKLFQGLLDQYLPAPSIERSVMTPFQTMLVELYCENAEQAFVLSSLYRVKSMIEAFLEPSRSEAKEEAEKGLVDVLRRMPQYERQLFSAKESKEEEPARSVPIPSQVLVSYLNQMSTELNAMLTERGDGLHWGTREKLLQWLVLDFAELQEKVTLPSLFFTEAEQLEQDLTQDLEAALQEL